MPAAGTDEAGEELDLGELPDPGGADELGELPDPGGDVADPGGEVVTPDVDVAAPDDEPDDEQGDDRGKPGAVGAVAGEASLPTRLCRQLSACGCGQANCEAEWTRSFQTAAAPQQMTELVTCAMKVGCPALCSDANDPQGVYQRSCVQPVMTDLARQSDAQRRAHETTMRILGNIKPSHTDVYRDGVRVYSY